MSRRLLLPGRDRIPDGVSLPEWDVLERDKLGGSVGVPSLPSWKVHFFLSALSALSGARVVVFVSLRPCWSLIRLTMCTGWFLYVWPTPPRKCVNTYPFISHMPPAGSVGARVSPNRRGCVEPGTTARLEPLRQFPRTKAIRLSVACARPAMPASRQGM